MYWCFDCGSSLAEFEIEYADRKSTTVDVAFLAADPAALAAAFGVPAIDKDAFAVIWTTTPWTIPANQALNLNPKLEYALVDTERGLLVLASALVEKCLARYGLEGRVVATAPASASTACASAIRSPRVDPATTGVAPVYLADYATAEDGTGIVHSSPAYGIEDFDSCRAHGLAVDDILNPVQGNGVYDAALPLFGGHGHLEGDAGDRRGAARRRPPARQLDARAQLSALLAPQDAGDLPRRGAVVRAHGRAPTSRRAACSPSIRRRRRCASARSTRSTPPTSIPRTAAPACTT